MTRTMLEKVKRHGLKGSATRSLILIRWHLEALRKQYEQVRKQYELFRLRNAPRYANPSPSELSIR
jgi:hypothetical protein